MGLNLPSITGANFSALLQMQSLPPIKSTTPINIPLNFAGVTGLNKFTGSYTPNDDYLYLFQGLNSSNAYNFMIVLCDSQLNITCSFSKSVMVLPVQRFGFYSWVIDPSNFIRSMFIDGRTGPNPGNTPMAQGQVVNYEIIAGQAIIS